MSIKEHEDNRFIKQNDEIEKYLLRIIQRYFDIENTFTKESIEAIIIESLARFKQIAIKEKGFIFSLNKKTGNITLTIRDFGGESAFNKNTAFNKDFGKQAGTVCEGNDERLSDDREPLEHIHNILNIENLVEKISNIDISNDATHMHKNKNILDMIRYTGIQAQIDLIIIEQLETAMKYYYDALTLKKKDVKDIYNKQLDILKPYRIIIDSEIANIKELIEASITWLNDIKEYVNKKLDIIKNNTLDGFIKHVSTEKIQSILDLLSTVYFISNEGELLISDGIITCNPITNDTMTDGTPLGTCFVEERTNISTTIPVVNNPKVKFYFRYDNDNETFTVPLPFCIKNGNTNIIIEGNYTETGKLNITSRHIVKLPAYGTNDNIYSSDTIIIESRNDIRYYDNIVDELERNNCSLCLIDSVDKNTFVQNLLRNDETYFIQGINFSPEGTDFVDNEGTLMNYFNWDTGQPVYNEMLNVIYLNENKKWAIVQNRYSEMHGYILEYKIKKLADIYKNPRVYYQVLENKEVV